MKKPKLVIVVTVPVVLETWFKGQPKFLSEFFDVEIITSDSKNIGAIQSFEGVSIKVFDLRRSINPFADVKTLWRMVNHFIMSRPDIVYTLTPKAGLLGMAAAFLSRVPYRIHNIVGLPHLEAEGMKKWILICSEKVTYLFATRLYCNSINLTNEIQKLTYKKVAVIGNGSVNGVDTEYFSNVHSKDTITKMREQHGISGNDFVLIYIGRMVNDKGINELVRVFLRLYEKYSHLKLLLVGDYSNESDRISDTTKHTIDNEKGIIYKEFQEDVREYLAMSDLFVLPSYREGLPNVLIEAGSFGLPLVATNINGCNEIIVNNENGVLVNKKDESSLYDALEKFVSDQEYYQKIQRSVRSTIVSRYSKEYFYGALKREFLSFVKEIA